MDTRLNDYWCGAPYPRKLHLLDTTFSNTNPGAITSAKSSTELSRLLISGINVRMITTETAEALASIQNKNNNNNNVT